MDVERGAGERAKSGDRLRRDERQRHGVEHAAVLRSPLAPRTSGYAEVAAWPYDPPKARMRPAR